MKAPHSVMGDETLCTLAHRSYVPLPILQLENYRNAKSVTWLTPPLLLEVRKRN